MSLNIFNRLIVSPGKQHRQIIDFLFHELSIQPVDTQKKKEHLRIEFVTQNRPAVLELRTLAKIFSAYHFDLIWFEEPCTYVKALKVIENSFYPTAYLGWGLNDYLNEEKHPEHDRTAKDFDWTALEYDLLLASSYGGFLENTKIIPEFFNFEVLDCLKSRQFEPDSLSAKALVMHAFAEEVDIQQIPTDYLLPELYVEAFERQLLSFEELPDAILSEEFLEAVCLREGKEIFLKIPPKQLSEDICLAAITAAKDPISLREIPNVLRTQIICEFALQQEIHQFRFVPKKIITQEFCNQFPAALQFIPSDFKTLELCKLALRQNESNLAFVPRHFISKTLVNQMVRAATQPNAFLEFVPIELFTPRLVKVFIKKNPSEFKFIPDEFKTYEITKKYVIREIGNLAFAPHEMLDDLLKHRTIKNLFLKHEHSLNLLPKFYLSKEFVLEVFKSKGIRLEEIPNHLVSEPLLLLAVRRIQKSASETEENQSPFQSIAMNCSKPKVWQLIPPKLKDYAFCKIAIEHAHPAVQSNVLVHLIDTIPRELEAFNDSIQWLYYFIETRLSLSFRDQHLFQIDLSDYLDTTLNGSSRGEEEMNIFVRHLIDDIVHTPKQLQAFQDIGAAAWRLWIEVCAMLYPTAENIELKGPVSFQAARFLHSSQQVKILNLYLKIAEEVNLSQQVEAGLTLD